MAIYKFPEGFTWGAATSGPQSEGWTDKPHFSIYDHWFQIEPEAFHNGVGPAVNCDTYRKFKEDVKLMKEIGLKSFRTSIQWTRLIKDFDSCEVDEKAVKFYNDYINDDDSVDVYSPSGKVKPSSKMGYISSVEDARKKLENLFKGLK